MKNYNRITKGWFSEICHLWPGAANSFEIESVLYNKKSKFQQIEVYQTRHHGRMLVLDGIVQLTEFDEFAYHEMLTHIPMFAHPNPESVLVIGGGDGGVLREIGRHDGVKAIDFCEIDESVMTVSKAFFPKLACGFDDPRVNIFIRDGIEFIQEKSKEYDLIIVDSSDPIGPAADLFEKPFYRSLKAALRPGGIMATQGESLFLHKKTVIKLAQMTKALFPLQAYAHVLVPTYPGGHIGLCLGSLGPDLRRPSRSIHLDLQTQLKYYNPEIHEAAFILPRFAKQMLETGDENA